MDCIVHGVAESDTTEYHSPLLPWGKLLEWNTSSLRSYTERRIKSKHREFHYTLKHRDDLAAISLLPLFLYPKAMI